jgi:glycosyltransferase involved in cell wall biosynthesis
MTTDRLHVLVVHNRYRSEQPSGENAVVDHETKLLSDAGHQVERFERSSDGIANMSLRGRVGVPLRVPWDPAQRRVLTERIRRRRPDIVHIHNTFPLLSPSVLAACSDAGVPAVATLHNYAMVCPPGTLYRDGSTCSDCVGKVPLPAVRHGCYRDSSLATVPVAANVVVKRHRWWPRVARFFCISGAQRDILVRAGMPAHRLTVKPNSVPDPGVRRVGLGEHVLFLGRLTEEKGVRLLMAAWDRVAAAGGLGLPLVLAGSGPLESELAQWAAGRPDVRYLGLRTQPECRELTSRAVAVVAPSTWPEVFGLVVVEAMAAGVPTIVPSLGAFPELVEEGVTGLLHEPGSADALADALRRMSTDADENLDMGMAARRRYERDFTPSVGLERLVAGYRAAVADPAG